MRIRRFIALSLENLRHLKLHFELLNLLAELFDDLLSLRLGWLLLIFLKLLFVLIIVFFCLFLARLNLNVLSQLLFLLALFLLLILQLLLVKNNWLVRLK